MPKTQTPEENLKTTKSLEKSDQFSENLELKDQPEKSLEQIQEEEKDLQEKRDKVAKKIEEETAASDTLGALQQQGFEQKGQTIIEVENILQADLEELYLAMTPQEQQAFKKKGEEVTLKIVSLLQKTKLKVNKIVDLIKNWLKMIPGVNKFFLEQEAKIKADRILLIKQQEKEVVDKVD